jgi:hypothetical protein
MKTMIINRQTGREVQENQWVTLKDRKGFYSRYELLEVYEDDETARVRYLTGDDGYLYTTQNFHRLGLRKVLL